MRQRRLAAVAVAVAAIVALVAVATSSAARTAAAGKPIVIGAAIDLTKNMAPFDAPALEAAQIEIKKINAAGGVDGRPLEMKFLNDQLDPALPNFDGPIWSVPMHGETVRSLAARNVWIAGVA